MDDNPINDAGGCGVGFALFGMGPFPNPTDSSMECVWLPELLECLYALNLFYQYQLNNVTGKNPLERND